MDGFGSLAHGWEGAPHIRSAAGTPTLSSG
jgi:hypothetical protein